MVIHNMSGGGTKYNGYSQPVSNKPRELKVLIHCGPSRKNTHAHIHYADTSPQHRNMHRSGANNPHSIRHSHPEGCGRDPHDTCCCEGNSVLPGVCVHHTAKAEDRVGAEDHAGAEDRVGAEDHVRAEDRVEAEDHVGAECAHQVWWHEGYADHDNCVDIPMEGIG